MARILTTGLMATAVVSLLFGGLTGCSKAKKPNPKASGSKKTAPAKASDTTAPATPAAAPKTEPAKSADTAKPPAQPDIDPLDPDADPVGIGDEVKPKTEGGELID
jgi:hypothetical protein